MRSEVATTTVLLVRRSSPDYTGREPRRTNVIESVSQSLSIKVALPHCPRVYPISNTMTAQAPSSSPVNPVVFFDVTLGGEFYPSTTNPFSSSETDIFRGLLFRSIGFPSKSMLLQRARACQRYFPQSIHRIFACQRFLIVYHLQMKFSCYHRASYTQVLF